MKLLFLVLFACSPTLSALGQCDVCDTGLYDSTPGEDCAAGCRSCRDICD